MSNTTPNPKDVARRHANAVLGRKLAIEALKLRTVREVRQVVHTSESKA